MTRFLLLILSLGVLPAAAFELRPDNLFKLIPAYFAGKHEFARVRVSDPVWRSGRVPLMDVQPCEGSPACVILNGRRVELEPTPAELLHQRVEVVGRARGPAHTGVYLRVRFSPWAASDPDFLLVWATVRNRDRKVEIKGYSVARGQTPGREYGAGPEIADYNVMKYLTSHNLLELEIARELVHRQIFCLQPAEPTDTVRDEVAPLQHAGLITGAEAEARLNSLQTLAGVIDIARGRLMCDSPLTDQVDGALDQVRLALQKHVRQVAKPAVTPKPVVLPEAPPTAITPAEPNRP